MCKKQITNLLKSVLLAVLSLAMIGLAACGTKTPPKNPYVLSELSKTLIVEQTFTLEVLNLDEEDVVVWESSDFTVASVDNGIVTAIKPGETIITATVGNTKLNCNITVELIQTPVPVISIENATLDNGEYSLVLIKGESYQLCPIIKLDGVKQTCNFELTSESANVSVEGLNVIAQDLCEKVKLTATCTFDGEQFSIDCFITVREVA